MQLHSYRPKIAGIRSFSVPVRCPHCDDEMIAPYMSEFVEGGEIRHHWECDSCREGSTTAIPLTTH